MSRIGAMRRRLVLEAQQRIPDGGGGAKPQWRPVAGLWGAIKPVAENTIIGAEKRSATVTHRVTLRYRSDVLAGMRFTQGRRIFMIEVVFDPDEKTRKLICLVREDPPS